MDSSRVQTTTNRNNFKPQQENTVCPRQIQPIMKHCSILLRNKTNTGQTTTKESGSTATFYITHICKKEYTIIANGYTETPQLTK